MHLQEAALRDVNINYSSFHDAIFKYLTYDGSFVPSFDWLIYRVTSITGYYLCVS